jgi:hypothetical protein
MPPWPAKAGPPLGRDGRCGHSGDALAQGWGRHRLDEFPAHDLTQGFQTAIFGGKGSMRGQTIFEIEHARGIELAVERRLGEKSFVDCAHFACGLPKAARRKPRARARRDITVPTGTPVISATSR